MWTLNGRDCGSQTSCSHYWQCQVFHSVMTEVLLANGFIFGFWHSPDSAMSAYGAELLQLPTGSNMRHARPGTFRADPASFFPAPLDKACPAYFRCGASVDSRWDFCYGPLALAWRRISYMCFIMSTATDLQLFERAAMHGHD